MDGRGWKETHWGGWVGQSCHSKEMIEMYLSMETGCMVNGSRYSIADTVAPQALL